ncbi:hypothetical protein [Methylobacterium soli]|uniref:Uncharacterized protein n=1 Tax=Methylobacterium soli TaxID=553447 RepID=A0A6L3SWN6_9HYPH|nr:hypothetical protein [Methylobacterium soli]KAB1072075.1 hypothetical protein F6X53_28555 [Methylobacterium soli]GJE43758.1 hypothetical protein AEGHOMDF_2937 [Methylobacterium soli]
MNVLIPEGYEPVRPAILRLAVNALTFTNSDCPVDAGIGTANDECIRCAASFFGYQVSTEDREHLDFMEIYAGINEIPVMKSLQFFDMISLMARMHARFHFNNNPDLVVALGSDGSLLPIPASYWLTNDADIALHLHFRTNIIFSDGRAGEDILVNKSWSSTGFGINMNNKRYYSSDQSSASESSEGYLSPPLRLMMQASRALQVDESRRIGKKSIEHYISTHWSSDCGKLSEAKVGYMATLLRPPDQEKGGNLPQR